MAQQIQPLAGRSVAITGGARGIGYATAEACIKHGMRVAIGDIDAASCQAAAQKLGAGTIAFELDVTEPASFNKFLNDVEAQYGPLDVLINNAGIMQIGEFETEDNATTRRQLEINGLGVLFGMKDAIQRMRPRNHGHIINIASTAGKAGFPGGVTYCGTKWLVIGSSEAARGELHGTNVEVSCVMPVIVNTELATGLNESRFVKNVNPEDVAQAIIETMQVPQFDVFVPRNVGPLFKVTSLLPRNTRERVARAMKADQVLLAADHGKRAGYEDRASHSTHAEAATGALPAAPESTLTAVTTPTGQQTGV